MNSSAGDYGHIAFDVTKGMAETAFLVDDVAAAAAAATWMLTDPETEMEDDERRELERLALASAIRGHKWRTARRLLKSWSAGGRIDWDVFGRATLHAGKMAARHRRRRVKPGREPKLAGFDTALRHLGVDSAAAAGFLLPTTWGALSDSLTDTLAGAHRGDPLMAKRIFGEYEAAAWSTRADRAARPMPTRVERPALPPGAPWPEIITRYHQLGAWALPDLAVLGPVLDHWAALSRFDDAIQINQADPGTGRLDVYFFRSDPEGHLDHLGGCAYVPEADMIVCSLPYLDDLFGVTNTDWGPEREQIRKNLGGWDDTEKLATTLISQVQARARVLLEWVFAHEIGHAHHGHTGAPPDAEDVADAFFLDGVIAEDGVNELFLALSMQLRDLYAYSAQRQLHRGLTPDERQDLSILLDGSPDPTGHRPLIFRAVHLVQSLLTRIPELDTTGYYDEFAAALEGRSGKGRA
jgi:hypothetical protein